MIASVTHRFLFVHIPKNAGSSIQSCLLKYRMRRLTEGRGKHETFDSFNTRTHGLFFWMRSFAVVRNPWDRTLSGYNYLMGRMHPDSPLAGMGSFEDFVNGIEAGAEWSKPLALARPQYTFVSDKSGRQRVKRLLRYETLDRDFKQLCTDWGLEATLPHLNKGPKSGVVYRDAYTDETRAAVARIYAEDIRRFGYKFD
ncbi:MAG: sulfotransferase family 2 domain-containing protein [Devosia sp.]